MGSTGGSRAPAPAVGTLGGAGLAAGSAAPPPVAAAGALAPAAAAVAAAASFASVAFSFDLSSVILACAFDSAAAAPLESEAEPPLRWFFSAALSVD